MQEIDELEHGMPVLIAGCGDRPYTYMGPYYENLDDGVSVCDSDGRVLIVPLAALAAPVEQHPFEPQENAWSLCRVCNQTLGKDHHTNAATYPAPPVEQP